MASAKRSPPLDGSLSVLPGFVDFHAENNPTLPWTVFPSADGSHVEEISFLELARATHRLAHAIRPSRTGEDGQVVAVLIHCDAVLYIALLIAVVRAGFIPFPMSPRNSAEAICNMLEQTSCLRVITQPTLSPLVSVVQSEMAKRSHEVHLQELPSLQAIFPSFGAQDGQVSQEVESYPHSATSPHPDDITLYIHSSGSTGFPKPIPQTQKTILQWASCDTLIHTRDRGIRWCSASMPTFHTLGIFMQLYVTLTSGEAIAVFRPQAPASPVVPNPQNLLEVAKLTNCTGLPTIPAFIEIWAQSPESVKFLASLQILTFGGGPISETNGTKLAAAGVPLFAVYGGTEAGTPTRVFGTDDSQGPDADVKTSQDWAWIQFQHDVKPRWVPQGDGTYELQFLTCETHQPAVENLPDVKGYATSDLFEPHPSKKGLWKVIGRLDDVIVLSTGEKIVPIPQEGYLGSLPFVAGAVMFGRGQTQAGVLIELRPDLAFDPKIEPAVVQFRNKIWPYVEEANKLAPTFARIFKEYILFSDPAKLLPRAAKGTVMRKMALATYLHEIDNLYENVAASTNSNGVEPPSSWDAEPVEAWLSRHATIINRGQEPSSTLDIFEQGFDSLSATYLRNRIIGALRSSGDPSAPLAALRVSSDLVFAHPTIQSLAAAVVGFVHPEKSTSHSAKIGCEAIEEILERYSADLPTFPEKTQHTSAGKVALLTGSTGSFGSHVLADLLLDENIVKVYTLDRGPSPSDRQKSSFVDRGLSVGLLTHDKLCTLSGDLSRADLGLEAHTLDELKRTVTHIIHNAWKVDFNLSLSSFESHIANTRNIVDLCSSCTNAVKLFFTSSISAAQGWKLSDGPVPEEILPASEVAVGHGYGSSKYVVERLLVNASVKGLQATSLRIGQISGSTKTGAWNSTDWVPAIIKSSCALGSFPELPGDVSWIPMDVASRSLVDLIIYPENLPHVINIVHPRPVAWRKIFGAINEKMGSPLQPVPFHEWLAEVEAASINTTEQDIDNIPAIKLLRFFRSLGESSKAAPESSYTNGEVEAGGYPIFRSTKAQTVSSTLKCAKSLEDHDVGLWVEFWRGKGFLPAVATT